MYGQMTAGSWIYIGTQGILQGTYETFAAVAAKRFGGTLAGTLTVTGGCGGMGGAQPLAVTLNDGVCLVVDVDPAPAAPARRAPLPRRGGRRTSTTRSRAVSGAKAERAGPVGRPGRQLRHRAAGAAAPRRRRSTSSPTRPRRTTRCPTCPRASASATGTTTPSAKPEEFTDRARRVDGPARRGDGRLPWTPGPRCSTTATRSATRRGSAASTRAFAFPGFVPAYIRPLFCEGKGPFRWAALSGDPADIRATDEAVLDAVPGQRPPAPVDPRRAGAGRVPGPARAHLLARLRRAGQGGPAVQRDGRLRRAVRADRHRPRPPRLRLGRLAVPRDRGDGRRLRRDRRLAAAQRAGQHRVAGRRGCRSTTAAASASAGRSTPARSPWPTAPTLAAAKIERVLTNDPGMGVIRHVDSGRRRPTTSRCARTPRAACGCRHDGAHDVRRAVGRPGAGRPRIGAQRRLPPVRLDARGRVLREWFAGEAAARGLDLTVDRAGNQWAWWGDPDASGPGVVVGLAPGLGARRRRVRRPARRGQRAAAIDALRAAGVQPSRPVGVVNFGDEEGARFGVACAGSRMMTGALAPTAPSG